MILSTRGFRRLVARLRLDFPTRLRVEIRRACLRTARAVHRVRRRRRAGSRGGLSWPWTHVITIGREGGQGEIESILHEWAHALRWEIDPDGDQHDDRFFILFGRMYRRYLEE